MNDEQMKTVVDAILDKGLTIEEMIDVCVENNADEENANTLIETCLLYTSPSPRDATLSRMPSSA